MLKNAMESRDLHILTHHFKNLVYCHDASILSSLKQCYFDAPTFDITGCYIHPDHV